MAVTLGKSKTQYYHRLVAFTVCPCIHDEEGYNIDPFWGTPDWFSYYEIHHSDGNPKNNMSGNLFVLWWLFHRSLPRNLSLIHI